MPETKRTRLFDLRLGDRVLRDGQEYLVAQISRTPWSWAGQPIVYGMKFTIYLTPANFQPTAQKPPTSDKADWDIFWSQRHQDGLRLQALSRRIENCSMTEVDCIV